MKRKYAAMILGLTMALTSANLAYAADSSDPATEPPAESACAQTVSFQQSAARCARYAHRHR